MVGKISGDLQKTAGLEGDSNEATLEGENVAGSVVTNLGEESEVSRTGELIARSKSAFYREETLFK